MTFDAYEETSYQGVPIFLYRFNRGSEFWYYTSADQDIDNIISVGIAEFATEHYLAYPISDAGVVQSGEPTQDSIAITLPWVSPVAALFVGTPPSLPVNVAIFRKQALDPAAQARLSWMGTVSQVKRTAPGTAELTCNTIALSLQQNGLRLGWGRTCPYVLYDPKTCKADKTAHATTGVILALDGANLSVAEFASRPDNYFYGGFVEWLVADSTHERRAIQGHTGTVIQVIGLTDGMTVGLSVTAYRGCDRTIQTCNDAFANVDNNGSCPTLPGRSPFDGNPVF